MKPVLLAFLLSILLTGQVLASDAPLVAAASSLRQVWPGLMDSYAPKKTPRITFGSSGNLARQIRQGAPFDLFLSADATFAEMLFEQGKAADKPVSYTTGALAWVAPENSTVAQWLLKLADQKHSDTPFPIAQAARLAIANPAFAPYGRAAMDVLEEKGINATAGVQLSLGENAAQALQFALSGATAGGVVPLSLVSETVAANLPPMVVAEIPAASHQPLTHTMVLIGNPGDQARALFEFLRSEPAQTIFKQNGFRAVN